MPPTARRSRPARSRCRPPNEPGRDDPGDEGDEMRRVIDFYRLQIKVMREWQPTGGSRARRLLATLVISILSFAGAVILTPGFDLAPGAPIIGTLLVAALCLGVLNILVRPLFLGLFAGVSVIAVTIATLAFQVISFLVVPFLVDDLVVGGDPVRARRVARLRAGEHHPRRGLLDQQRRLLLRDPHAAGLGQSRRRRADGQAGPRRRPDRRPRPADPDPPDPGRPCPAPVQLGSLGPVPSLGLGGAPAPDHAGQPGRDPAREQRRHPGLPLVREGTRPDHGRQPPGGRDGGRDQDLEW